MADLSALLESSRALTANLSRRELPTVNLSLEEIEAQSRRLVSQQVSGAGLIIALYDALVADLHRAVEAERRNALEERGRHLKHGFAILTQLELMLSPHEETPAEKNLRRLFISMLKPVRQAKISQWQRNP